MVSLVSDGPTTSPEGGQFLRGHWTVLSLYVVGLAATQKSDGFSNSTTFAGCNNLQYVCVRDGALEG